MENYKIISIESRKGGVGKTLIARIMADVVISNGLSKDRKTRVVLLDFDILGTDPHLLSKTYIGNRIQVSRYNLLDFFSDSLRTDKFSLDEWDIENQEIFYIPSSLFIFRDLAAVDIASTFAPQLLFDELHSLWFVDFLRQLLNQFLSYPQYRKYDMVFIIDNPPGYSEFVPILEDFLVEVGPEKSKTLFVGTLDHQDLIASIQAIEYLYKKYLKAMLTAEYYYWDRRDIENDFIDAVFLDKILNNELEDDSFYKKEKDYIENIKKNPSLYLELIINKVPPELDKNDFYEQFDFEKIEKWMPELKKAENFYNHIKEQILSSEKYIPFNPLLSFRYFIENLKKEEIKLCVN